MARGELPDNWQQKLKDANFTHPFLRIDKEGGPRVRTLALLANGFLWALNHKPPNEISEIMDMDIPRWLRDYDLDSVDQAENLFSSLVLKEPRNWLISNLEVGLKHKEIIDDEICVMIVGSGTFGFEAYMAQCQQLQDLLKEHKKQIVFITTDINPDALARAQEQYQQSPELRNIQNIKFQFQQLDATQLDQRFQEQTNLMPHIIMSNNLLHHLSPVQREQVISQSQKHAQYAIAHFDPNPNVLAMTLATILARVSATQPAQQILRKRGQPTTTSSLAALEAHISYRQAAREPLIIPTDLTSKVEVVEYGLFLRAVQTVNSAK